MIKVCKEFIEYYEETVWEPVEDWVKKTERFCRDLPWPISLVCDLVTTFIKVVNWVARTIVNVVATIVCQPLIVILNVASAIVNIIASLPVIGPIYRAIFGAVVWLFSQVAGFVDAILSILGLNTIKHLRLHVIVLMRADRTMTVDPADLDDLLKKVEQVYRQRARVKIHTTIHSLSTPAAIGALHVDCGVGLLGEDLTEAGLYFQSVIRDTLWEHGIGFAIKVFAPVVAFVVDGVGDHNSIGCSSGPLADYVCVEGSAFIRGGNRNQMNSPTLAHEIGHACALPHDTDLTNLMYPSLTNGTDNRGNNLSPFQRAVVRSSPHVTYL